MKSAAPKPERSCIAGIDEVGRGPLAGPVVAAVAVIDRTLAKRKLLRLIDDFKKLTPEEREEAYAAILESGAVRYAVGEASVEEIDAINILRATFLAMRRALQAMAEQPDLVLIDGNQVPPELGCRAETIIGGDARSYSIAAASIIAKVTRDRYMRGLAAVVPRLRLGDQCRLRTSRASRRAQPPRRHGAPSPELRTRQNGARAAAALGRRTESVRSEITSIAGRPRSEHDVQTD